MDSDKDQKLCMFLGSLGEGVDVDTAQQILESHDWNVEAAIMTVTGGDAPATSSHAAPSVESGAAEGYRAPMRTGYTDTLLGPDPSPPVARSRSMDDDGSLQQAMQASANEYARRAEHQEQGQLAEALEASLDPHSQASSLAIGAPTDDDTFKAQLEAAMAASLVSEKQPEAAPSGTSRSTSAASAARSASRTHLEDMDTDSDRSESPNPSFKSVASQLSPRPEIDDAELKSYTAGKQNNGATSQSLSAHQEKLRPEDIFASSFAGSRPSGSPKRPHSEVSQSPEDADAAEKEKEKRQRLETQRNAAELRAQKEHEAQKEQHEAARKEREQIQSEATAEKLAAEWRKKEAEEAEQSRREAAEAEARRQKEAASSQATKKENDGVVSALVALRKAHFQKNREGLATCLQTLRTYIGNLARDVHEAKFQRIKCDTKAFQSRIAAFEGATAVLLACGFEQLDGALQVSPSFLKTKGSKLFDALAKVDVMLDQCKG